MKQRITVGASKERAGSVRMGVELSDYADRVLDLDLVLTNDGARQLWRDLGRAIKEADARLVESDRAWLKSQRSTT